MVGNDKERTEKSLGGIECNKVHTVNTTCGAKDERDLLKLCGHIKAKEDAEIERAGHVVDASAGKVWDRPVGVGQ